MRHNDCAGYKIFPRHLGDHLAMNSIVLFTENAIEGFDYVLSRNPSVKQSIVLDPLSL